MPGASPLASAEAELYGAVAVDDGQGGTTSFLANDPSRPPPLIGKGYISEGEGMRYQPPSAPSSSNASTIFGLPLSHVIQQIQTSSHFHPWTKAQSSLPQPKEPKASDPALRSSLRQKDGFKELEMQAHWLELRLLEIKHQRERLRAQKGTREHEGRPQEIAADHDSSLAATESTKSTDGLSPQDILSTAFYRLRSGAISFPTQPSQPPLLTLAAPVEIDEKCAPALVYASCDLMGHQLQQLRSSLTTAFPPESTSGGLGLRGGLPSSQRRMGLAASGQLPGILTRIDSGTRKRRAGEGNEERLEGLGSPTNRIASIDRVSSQQSLALDSCSRANITQQTQAIFIPPVRDLPPAEMQARHAALNEWSQHYRAMGEPAIYNTDYIPKAVQDVFADDEGNSSEDTSDENYSRLHKIQEEEEAKRYKEAALADEKKRRSFTGQQGKGKGQQGKSSKTPRASHPPTEGDHPMQANANRIDCARKNPHEMGNRP